MVGKSVNGIYSFVVFKYMVSFVILFSNLLFERVRCSYFFDFVFDFDSILFGKVFFCLCNVYFKVYILSYGFSFFLKKKKGK